MADDSEKKGGEGRPQAPVALKIGAEAQVAKGVYANLSIVHNNESEFVLDFIFTEPQRAQGHVVSRVIVNPKGAKRLLLGLTELVRRYEERFGEIEATTGPIVQGKYH
jgi:hypothetical protein